MTTARSGAGRRAKTAEHSGDPPARDIGDAPAVLVSSRAEGPGDAGPPRLAKILGAVVAPTTLLTALLYYFGWAHAFYFFDYFGVNSTVLGFGTVDYLMRSVDALFVPIVVVAITGLFALWADAALRARATIDPGHLAPHVLVRVLVAFGLVLAVGGFVSTFHTTFLSRWIVAAAPLSSAIGVLLLAYASRLRRLLVTRESTSDHVVSGWAGAAEGAIVFALVGISLFAAATDYAAAVGRARARHLVTQLPTQPNVVVYSERSLSLTAPGVRETRCRDPRAAFLFRYDGLKLILQSGGQYLFLPAEWTRANGVAILIPQGSALRLEFSPASAGSGTQPAAC